MRFNAFSLAPDAPTVTLHLTRGTGEGKRKASSGESDQLEGRGGGDSVREGEDVGLKCLADANPKVHTISWIYEVSYPLRLLFIPQSYLMRSRSMAGRIFHGRARG